MMLTVPVWAQSADEKETTESNAVRQDLAGLKYDHSLELQYADQFSVDYYEDGYALITIAGDGQFLLVPEGKEAPDVVKKALEEGLLKDEKELAEHNMLVDLGRNDIGKISKIGTVKVEKYLCVERFSHVMHLGSTVTGIIRDDKDAVDAVDSILPAGTLSGAPKFRACQIIEELEQSK